MPDFRDVMEDWERTVDFPAEAVIFRYRDPADMLYYVLDGQVELRLRGERFGVEGEGGVLGETALLEDGRRGATAIALTQVRLAQLETGEIRELMTRFPKFALHLMTTLANRLRGVDEYLTRRLGPSDTADDVSGSDQPAKTD